MPGRALIAGGSIGGLFAAAALRRDGWDVDVFERTAVELSGRGAGIVTHAELIAALTAVGASTEDLGVLVEERVAFGLSGARVKTLDYPQVVTSWDRMHNVLRALMPEGSHHLGRAAAGYRTHDDRVELVFDDGTVEAGDLLVGADGFRSAIRGQMLPEVKPAYSGYVVWRTVAAEARFPENLHREVFAPFGFFIPNGTQIIAYPIAGPGNDLRPGHRRFNFVWYSETPADRLTDMLTDAAGTHHAVSIPPPLVRDDVVAEMMERARATLPVPFVKVLEISERPFFTPIYDHHSPVMADGRVALVGDSACVARPHVGMGVTKAAQDALALARHLGQAPVPQAVQAYSDERVPACRIAYERSQWLGRLIFDAPRDINQDGADHAEADTVMRETAVVPPELGDAA